MAKYNKEMVKIKKQKRGVLVGILLSIIIYAGVFIYAKYPDIIGFKEEIKVEGTNLSVVQLYNNEWGVINTQNSEYAIPPRYLFIEHFCKDLFIFKKRDIGACGLINSKNRIIFNQNYRYEAFDYLVNDSNIVFGSGYITFKYNDGKKSLYNSKGEKLLSDKFYIEGTIDNYIKIRNNKNKYGLADTLGNIVLPAKYNDIISIKDSYAITKIWNGNTKKIKLSLTK